MINSMFFSELMFNMLLRCEMCKSRRVLHIQPWWFEHKKPKLCIDKLLWLIFSCIIISSVSFCESNALIRTHLNTNPRLVKSLYIHDKFVNLIGYQAKIQVFHVRANISRLNFAQLSNKLIVGILVVSRKKGHNVTTSARFGFFVSDIHGCAKQPRKSEFG